VKVFVREPALGAVTLGMLALMAVFIVLPQVQGHRRCLDLLRRRRPVPVAEIDAAKRLGYLRDLDWLCRRAALEHGDASVRSSTLFINVSLASLLDPLHGVDQIVLLCECAGRSPRQAVLEISEQAEARDLGLLQDVVHAYRDEGFRFAVDDVGEGHSTLELLVAVDPEFIKIARSLITNLDSHSARSAVESIVVFANAQGSNVIAEGIVAAAREVALHVPLVVRLEGTNVRLGKKILSESGLPILSADNLADAAEKVVKAVKEAA